MEEMGGEGWKELMNGRGVICCSGSEEAEYVQKWGPAEVCKVGKRGRLSHRRESRPTRVPG